MSVFPDFIFGVWLGKADSFRDKAALLIFFADCLIIVLILFMIFGILEGKGYNLIRYVEASVLQDTPELANGVFLSILNRGIAIGIAIGGFLLNDFGVMSIFVGGVVFLV